MAAAGGSYGSNEVTYAYDGQNRRTRRPSATPEADSEAQTMKISLVLSVLIPSIAFGSCPVPKMALEKLRAYLSYESSFPSGVRGELSFDFALAGREALFLQHRVPPHFDTSARPVYVYMEGVPLLATSCQSNSDWTLCAQQMFRDYAHNEAVEQQILPIKQTCTLPVTVPKWHPSPNGTQKRKLAMELLQEVEQFGYSSPEQVYMRDFNIDDPELEFYIVDPAREQAVQGCTFDSQVIPHCKWHSFGQASIGLIKKQIMARSYRLFPEVK